MLRRVVSIAVLLLAASGAQAQYTNTTATGFPSVTFAQLVALGPVRDGRVRYCSDCTQTDTCAGSGTGAIAFRINAAWSCRAGGPAAFPATATSAQLRSSLSDELGTGAALFDGATPTSFVLTNATSLPVSTGISGLGTGVATFLATPSSANLRSAVTDETGSGGALVFATSPALTGPTTDTLQTSGNVGVGKAPSVTTGIIVDGLSTGNYATVVQITNSDAADTGSEAQIKVAADTATMLMRAHGTARTVSRFGSAVGGWAEILATGLGLKLGTSNATPFILGTNSINVLQIDGSQNVSLTQQAITAGTMTGSFESVQTDTTTCRSWTNAMVAALPTTAGDIAWGTLPAKTKVVDAVIIINTAAVGPTTVTVALGRTAATYIDYIVASDAKAAANTIYGDVSGERGTNLTGYDLPSYTGTTVVNAHFVSTGANLSTVTGSTGTVCVTTRKLP